MKATIVVNWSQIGILKGVLKEEEMEGKKKGEGGSRLIFNGKTLISKDFNESFLRNPKK